MHPEGGTHILHTIKPKCLIECVNIDENPNTVSSGLPHRIFEYRNTDGITETWELTVRDTYDNSELHEVGKCIERAWRWYRSYLEWEDGNIDTEEELKWN